QAHPWYRPAVQQRGHLLRLMDRTEEAASFLEQAAIRIESGAILAQLGTLREEYGDVAAARACFARLPEFWPLVDKPTQRWLNLMDAHLAYRLGETVQA